jgi:hypothetical protein
MTYSWNGRWKNCCRRLTVDNGGNLHCADTPEEFVGKGKRAFLRRFGRVAEPDFAGEAPLAERPGALIEPKRHQFPFVVSPGQ